MKFVDEQQYKNDIGIYKIVNLINGKAYIGQTKEKFQRRYWLHKIEQELLKGASVEELSIKYGLHKKSIQYYQKKLNKH